ncbi:MAG: ABC transporter permease [Thermoanaerobaculia bacterium]
MAAQPRSTPRSHPAVRLAFRLLATVALAWIVLTAVFFLLHALPGEPGAAFEDPRVPPRQRAQLREIYRLDRPLAVQYASWLGGVARGEWGYSFSRQRPVSAILGETLPPTLLLSSAALGVELALGLGLGVFAAARAHRLSDHLIRAGSLLLWSVPAFWFGLLLFLLFAIRWPLFPAGGMTDLGPGTSAFGGLFGHLVLPALALGVPAGAATARFVRATLLDQLSEPYITAARARGLSFRSLLWNHALRAGLGPILQVAGLSLAALLSGTLVVEVVFAWPGLGRATYEALVARDYPLLLAGTTLSALTVLAGSLVVESVHALVDPRVRDV